MTENASEEHIMGVIDTSTARFESGQLGNPRYQIDVLVPSLRSAVRVQLDDAAAEAMVRWHNPYGVHSQKAIRENPGLESDDGYLDAVIAAVHAWVAETFPPNFPAIVGWPEEAA